MDDPHKYDTVVIVRNEDGYEYAYQSSFYLNNDVMVAIHEATLLVKLTHNRSYINGIELVETLSPNYKGFAVRVLDRHRETLKHLEKVGYIKSFWLSTPTHGYGDDEGFQLTAYGLKMMG